jgi:WD40 repeat protein
LHVFEGHGFLVRGAVFSHNGKWLATCGADNKAHIWDLASQTELKVFDQPRPAGLGRYLTHIAFSPDDKLLLTSASNSNRLWNVESGKLERETGRPCLAVSKDGRWLLTPDSIGNKMLITALGQGEKGYEEVAKREFPAEANGRDVHMLAASGEGKWVIGAAKTIEGAEASQGIAYLVDFATFKDINSFKMSVRKGIASDVKAMVLSTDGKRLFTASSDGKACLWDVETGRVIRVFDEPMDKKP